MLSKIARGVTARLVERLVIGTTRSWGEIPIASDTPHVHAMGPDPHRILLLGSGAVAGVGVASHEVGVGGHLARQLSAITGRGVDIDLVGRLGLSASRATELAEGAAPRRFDAAVLMLGSPEALGLGSVAQWERDLRTLLRALRQSSPFLAVFVVGVAPIAALVPLHRVIGVTVSRQIVRLNAASERVCGEEGAHFVRFALDVRERRGRHLYAPVYAEWAAPIAHRLARTLDEAVPVPHRYSLSEEARQSSLNAMDILDSPPTAEVEAITRVARDLFGVTAAAVNLIDRDRQFEMSASGVESGDRPRSESFCTITVELGGLLVIGDTTTDPRVRGLPAVAGGIRFYAGYPVEAPDGQRVGTLCLLDTRPRSFTASDASLLRELALRVQRELWRRVEVTAG